MEVHHQDTSPLVSLEASGQATFRIGTDLLVLRRRAHAWAYHPNVAESQGKQFHRRRLPLLS